MKVEFYKHTIDEEDIKRVNEVLRSIFLTTSSKTKEFEDKFSKYLGVKYAVGTNSATSALHLLLKSVGIKAGDEVITTPLTFVATANAIEFLGAKPVFVDVEEESGLIDLDRVEEAISPKTKAIVIVHLYGNMVNVKRLNEISEKYNIPVIEDAAHAIESRYEGISPGSLTSGACFSFYATKNITSGEGGALVTNIEEIYERTYRLRLHGLSKSAVDRYKRFTWYDMPEVGYKYNMYDIQAALLVGQLDRIEKLLERRSFLANRYIESLKDKVEFPRIPEKVKTSWHLFTIWVEEEKRNFIIEHLQKNNIGVSVHYKPVHLMSYYKNKYGYKEGDFKNAEKISKRTITLPLYPSLKEEEQDYVIEKLLEVL